MILTLRRQKFYCITWLQWTAKQYTISNILHGNQIFWEIKCIYASWLQQDYTSWLGTCRMCRTWRPGSLLLPQLWFRWQLIDTNMLWNTGVSSQITCIVGPLVAHCRAAKTDSGSSAGRRYMLSGVYIWWTLCMCRGKGRNFFSELQGIAIMRRSVLR